MILSLLFSCNPKEEAHQETPDKKSKTQRVEVVQPEHRSFTADVLISGTLRPNRIVTLYGMESGMVVQMRKDIGDRVRNGEIIARLSNPVVTQLLADAEAEIQMANANLEAAKADEIYKSSISERLRSTHERTPALTQIAEVEKAEGEAKMAAANVQRGEAALLAAQNKLELAKSRNQQLQITAPFSGIITDRFVDQGAMIQNALDQGDPQAIVEIQEINPLRLTLPVPETDALAIKEGTEALVTIPELSGGSFTANVSRLSGALDPMSKTMQVEIDLKNPDGKILSGMYAQALLQVDSRENILSLPAITRVSHKNEDYVLAVVDGVVKRLPVKAGLTNQDYFEVLNDEISLESQVIVEGKSLVKPGQIVEPILKQDQ